MVLHRVAAAAALAALVLGASVSSASARCCRHWGHSPFGIVGAVVGGAATIATAPFAIVGGALSGGEERRPRYEGGYRDGPRYSYRPREGYYGRPRYYRRPRYDQY